MLAEHEQDKTLELSDPTLLSIFHNVPLVIADDKSQCNQNMGGSDPNDATEKYLVDDAIEAESVDCNGDDINMEDVFSSIKSIRMSYRENIIICHLNVNSLWSKLSEVKHLQSTCKLDVLVLSETKLDDSYKQDVLDITGYTCVRQDKRSNSGGLIAYVSNDIPFSVGKTNTCNDEIECLSIELNICDETTMLLAMYKNPKTDPVTFKRFFEEACEEVSDKYENIVIIGDLNFNMLQDNMLSAIIPCFNLSNVINEPTCFKSKNPTLIDVMLVTKRRKMLKTFSENIGVSDFHNLIGAVLRNHKPSPKTKRITVRKISKIKYDKLLSDLSKIDLTSIVNSAVDANSACDALQTQLRNLLDKYAPKKQKTIKKTDFPCMSKKLKKAILYRNKLRNKYYKSRLDHSLEQYKLQRNVVNDIKKQEIRKYFEEKCRFGTRNKDFWKTVKPFFSKSRTKTDSIALREDGEIITDDQRVCMIFNNFFQSIGSDIGFPENNDKPLGSIIKDYAEHISVKKIKKLRSRSNANAFTFRFVTKKEIIKTIRSLSSRKAAGFDEIPAQLIKRIGPELAESLTFLINRCILEKTFPAQMKKANITPLYKKKDKLNKDNYRSVNLLPFLSKVFEKILFNQIYEHTSHLFHNYLTGFRRGHSCQDILIRLTEDWREALDNNLTVGAIAIDLSKAFDCMPHGLLLAKLAAYGFDEDACELMRSYIMKRQQRVKIGEMFSDWINNIKGVPQGSILGPLLFNIFMNDFLFFDFNSKIYNYADDNTFSCAEFDTAILKKKLESDCHEAMNWFELNSMKANANKFQLMFLSRCDKNMNDSIRIGQTTITSSQSINILGIELDNKLSFNIHTDEICSQAGKQINALKRIKQHLDRQCKMTIYNSYINSVFNYGAAVWRFTSNAHLDKLERTNKRALRFVTNKGHLTYEEMCKQEGQLTIRKKCIKSLATTIYKIRNGSAPRYLQDLIRIQNSPYDMRDHDKCILPEYKTIRFGKRSLRYFGAKLWNSIPKEIKRSPSLNTFKSAISKWLFNTDVINE